ncbi:DUF3450 family protein [Sedimentisphaera salicampi]|uniref:Chromosome segregation protein SMC n=1 Tax=Sedimentisphaera salicampi TaxID=1941349 RepID=A0A1W6LN81_9BACT|nr:DUF3450 family protein [Sedimentisphaera salicampi]ARN57238.1 chromosome segregation protein SMC [Sedimentisphaera salicampi]OXU14679.1 chromosome segregation protein SMC [Sedimentisphaera salicampi]
MKSLKIFFSERRLRSLCSLAMLGGIVLLLTAAAEPKQASSNDIESAKTKIEKWVETKRLISEEKRDFKLSREMLNERIELLQNEIESLEKKKKDAEESIAEADKKRQEMMKENDKLKEASSSLSDMIVKLEGRTKELIKRLPAPLKSKVKPLSQRLPENPEKTETAMSQRFQNVVGILNEVDKFNREISAHSEVRELEDGSSFEVVTLYIGISHAYYASSDGTVAGVGYPAEGEWDWREKNEAAQDILDAAAILKNEKVASFVKLPVEIQ